MGSLWDGSVLWDAPYHHLWRRLRGRELTRTLLTYTLLHVHPPYAHTGTGDDRVAPAPFSFAFEESLRSTNTIKANFMREIARYHPEILDTFPMRSDDPDGPKLFAPRTAQ